MPSRRTKTPEEFAAYFWARKYPCKKTGCWLWLGPKSPAGYGKQGKRLAHRVAWEMVNGTIKGKMCILHSCDNPACINPNHLFQGTHADNMRDMKNKGRRKNIGIGEANGRARLSKQDIDQIRNLGACGVTLRDLGSQFGVSFTTIGRILRKETWSHVK